MCKILKRKNNAVEKNCKFVRTRNREGESVVIVPPWAEKLENILAGIAADIKDERRLSFLK